MKVAALAAGLFAAIVLVHPTSAALSDNFHNKWPWPWTTSAQITTLPFQGVHGCQLGGECVAAYDLVIVGDQVRSGAQGQVTLLDNTWTTCDANGHYGNFVDIDGKRYAHLAVLAPSIVVGANLLQGDAAGTQGATGHVLPCDYPTDQRGKHLHWEFLGAPSVPPVIDGTNTNSLVVSSQPSSSNSVVGEFSTEGATLRSYYIAHGGWGNVGWTYRQCPGACTLNMTANLSWGRMQDFRHDPDGFGGTFDTITVDNFTPTQAFLVDSVFWPNWASGGIGLTGASHPFAMAGSERGACPLGSSSNCVGYQHFPLGFVWMDRLTGRHGVFCPDLDGDQQITIVDLSIESTRYLMTPLPPTVDVDGDGLITIVDISIMGDEMLHDCHV
jgi:hypothetical protein